MFYNDQSFENLTKNVGDFKTYFDKRIENAAIEALEPVLVQPSVNTVLKCRICNLEALEYITCSLCSMFVHFNCNIPKVSNFIVTNQIILSVNFVKQRNK